MRAEMARGAAWMVAFRLFDRTVGVLSTTILARLLIPADFGLVAMAMSVIAIIELATSFSFEIALIQNPHPQREHYDTAWSLNVLLALGGATLTCVLAHAAASFYGDPRLVPIMFCIAGGWIVSGTENPGIANFRRRMDFAAEFRFMASKRVVMFLVSTSAAIVFRSYWALVFGMVTGRVVGTVLSYAMEPYRPRWSLARARELFSFSGWLLATNMAGVVLSRLPHFVVGRTFGAQSLGAYTVGWEIAQLAHTELVAPINRAMFPGYARLASEPEAFRRVCLEATAAILLVVLPTSFAVAVFAEPIVRLLLGVKWHDAVPIIQILAFSGAVSAITSNNASAYLALGRPHFSTMILFTRLSLFTVAALLFVRGHGMTVVAYSELVAALGSLLVSLPLLFRTVHIRLRDYLTGVWRPLAASLFGASGVYFALRLDESTPGLTTAIGQLALGLPLGLLLYLCSLWALWQVSGRPASIEPMLGRRILGTVGGWIERARKPTI